MEKFTEKIVDIETGETSIREYTVEETEEIIAARKKAELENLEIEQKIQARLDILAKLGLTEDEAKVLLS